MPRSAHLMAKALALLLAAALAILPAVAFASPNLLTNGSFESGATGWTSLSCGAAVEVSSNQANYAIPAPPDGINFAEVECDLLSPTTTQDYIQQSVATVSGKTYVVSTYAVTRLQFNTGDKMIISANGTSLASVTTGNSWTNYFGSFVAAGSASAIRYLSNGSTSSTTSGAQPGDSIGLMVDNAQVQALTVTPAAQSTAESTNLIFSSAQGNALQIASNATGAATSISLSVSHGTLTLASTTGLTFTVGSNGAAIFTVSGTAAAINTALSTGFTYAPTKDYNGADTLSFTATEGTASETDPIAITITPLANITADTVTTTENRAITFNAITGSNGATADSFQNTPSSVVVSSPSHGTAVAASSPLGDITYTPATNFFGTDTFTYTVTSGGVTETATETVNVTALAPTVTVSQISTGGTGTFNFSGSNGVQSRSLTTVTPGLAVNGAADSLTTAGLATTVTQASNAAFLAPSASCVDNNSTYTGKTGSFGALAGNTLTIPAANTIGGAIIVCTFINAQIVQSMTITKTYVASPVPVALGQAITYTYTVTNTGNVAMTNVQVKDMHGSPATQVSLGAGGITSETLTAAGSGGSFDTTPNDGIWSSLAPGATVTFTWVHIVTQSEIDHG